MSNLLIAPVRGTLGIYSLGVLRAHEGSRWQIAGFHSEGKPWGTREHGERAGETGCLKRGDEE